MNHQNLQHKKQHKHILLAVVISMILIVAIWSIWFFPKVATQQTQERNFASFKQEIKNAFSIFSTTKQEPEKINIDDLRQRVFGDTIGP